MKLPIISGDEAIKILNKKGFKKVREKKHVVLTKITKQGKKIVIVPRHRELAKGTLLSIMSQSGMTRDEFFS